MSDECSRKKCKCRLVMNRVRKRTEADFCSEAVV